MADNQGNDPQVLVPPAGGDQNQNVVQDNPGDNQGQDGQQNNPGDNQGPDDQNLQDDLALGAEANAMAPPIRSNPYANAAVIPLYGTGHGVIPKQAIPKSVSFAEQLETFAKRVGVFHGNPDEDVMKYIKLWDQAMMDLGMNSKSVATALREGGPIKGRAATFVNRILRKKSTYPGADHYCQQTGQLGREWLPFQAGVPGIASIASADGVPGRHHVSTIAEIPDQPALPFFEEIHPNACLRHYIICEFKKKISTTTSFNEFRAAQTQSRTTTVREFIWNLDSTHHAYKTDLWGFEAEYKLQANKADYEKELVEFIKEGCVREFKDFYQNRQKFQPMITLQDCEILAKQFEEDTEPGKIFTQKCRSHAKAEHVMAAEVKTQNLVPGNYNNPNYSGSYSSAPPISPPQQTLPSITDQLATQQAQQAAQSAYHNVSHPPYQIPPCPDNITEDNWIAAHTANFAMISALTTQPPNQNPGNFRGNNRGGYRGGGRGNRGGGRGGRGGQGRGGQGQGRGRGGRGRGQQQQQNPARPPPPPNKVPPGCEEWWNCTAQMEAKCLYPNPTNKGRCGYCYVPGHCYSQCGYKRMDVQAGQHYNVHPQAGKLPAKKHAFEQYPAANNRQQKEQRFAVSAARGELNIDSQQQQIGQQQQQQQQQQNPQELANMIAAAMAQQNQQPQPQNQAGGAQHYGASALTPTLPPVALHAGASQHKGGAQGGAIPKPTRPPISNQRKQEVYNVFSNWAEEKDRQQAQQQLEEGYEFWA